MMTQEALDAFVSYLMDTFEEVFDDSNIDHCTKAAIFTAGYYAGFDEARDH